MRDLSLMSQAIDKLRSGSVATTGDLLAGHFLAAHQALIDQSWSQARYLEVADQDEQNATPAAILLEARKHAKASFKDWQGRFPDMPVGLVIDYMASLGHGGFQGAAEGKEQACAAAL
eukprot:g28999.t1